MIFIWITEKRDLGLFYVNDYSLAINLRSIANHEFKIIPELNFDRPTLPAIFALIENDVFWKTPTNLLSFFYGLPDSREEFREVFKLRILNCRVHTERRGYVLQGVDVNLFLAQYTLEQENDKVKAKEYAETALKLATCDGPPYYYKVAYEEAERMLEKLK